MEICQCCGRSNNRTKYHIDFDTILCDSCLVMYKKYPVIYIPPIGELHYDNDGNILCHVCGRGFKKLTEHIRSKHGLDKYEYKEKFGLNRGVKLTGKNFVPNITIPINEVDCDTKFKKGHSSNKGIKRRLQTIKTRTGMKYSKKNTL